MAEPGCRVLLVDDSVVALKVFSSSPSLSKMTRLQKCSRIVFRRLKIMSVVNVVVYDHDLAPQFIVLFIYTDARASCSGLLAEIWHD